MLRVLAQREGTSVEAILTRELDHVACAYSDELEGLMPEIGMALAWPGWFRWLIERRIDHGDTEVTEGSLVKIRFQGFTRSKASR